MLTSSSSELSSDSSRSWFASSIESAVRADFLALLLVSLLLTFLSAAFRALASLALAVLARALSALDWLLLLLEGCELGPPGWKSILSTGGGEKVLPAENWNVLGSVEN